MHLVVAICCTNNKKSLQFTYNLRFTSSFSNYTIFLLCVPYCISHHISAEWPAARNGGSSTTANMSVQEARNRRSKLSKSYNIDNDRRVLYEVIMFVLCAPLARDVSFCRLCNASRLRCTYTYTSSASPSLTMQCVGVIPFSLQFHEW